MGGSESVHRKEGEKKGDLLGTRFNVPAFKQGWGSTWNII